MTMRSILLTVHATSTWNELGRGQGHCDPELSETGLSMARMLAQRGDLNTIKTIFASDLKRAYQTALPLAERLGVPLVRSASLREGNWEDYYRDPELPPLPFDGPYETPATLQDRAVRAMHDVASSLTDDPILVVSHGGFVKCFIEAAAPSLAGDYRGIRTALNRLEFHGGEFSVVSLNDDSHVQGIAKGFA